MDIQTIFQFIILGLLLLLSAFFSSAETALTTANEIRLKALAEEGDRAAKRTLAILDQYGKMLSAILIGNNIVNISASALTTTIAFKLWGSVAISIATGVLTLLVLIFGEIIPKNIAKIHAEGMARAYSSPIKALMLLLTPIIFLIDKIAYVCMRLIGIDPNSKAAMTETELRSYVDVGHEDGILEQEEKEMIINVFDFSDSVAKDVMIPRIDMTTIPETASYDEVLGVFRQNMYTRLPVYREEPDQIIGLINIKDFIWVEDHYNFHVSDILRDAFYTHEFKKTADLLMEMREKSNSVTFVLNEYGATVGMITLEDLLEEIVGEIRDEYDEDEKDLIKKLDDQAYLVQGSVKLSDINDALSCNLHSQDYDSIGGLVIEHLDRLPLDGDHITTADGIKLTVHGASNNRVEAVEIVFPEPAAATTSEENEATPDVEDVDASDE